MLGFSKRKSPVTPSELERRCEMAGVWAALGTVGFVVLWLVCDDQSSWFCVSLVGEVLGAACLFVVAAAGVVCVSSVWRIQAARRRSAGVR